MDMRDLVPVFVNYKSEFFENRIVQFIDYIDHWSSWNFDACEVFGSDVDRLLLKSITYERTIGHKCLKSYSVDL